MEDILIKCRLCLKKSSENNSDLFLRENGESYAEQILDKLSIELQDTPNWPRHACPECIDFLVRMSNFKQVIIASHKSFHALIKSGLEKYIKVTKQCRLCLSISSEDFVNLFCDVNGTNYSHQILDLLSIEITNTSQWPCNACLECIKFLQVIPSFRNQIMSSHKNLFKEVTSRSYLKYQEKALEDEITMETTNGIVTVRVKECPSSLHNEDTLIETEIFLESDLELEVDPSSLDMNIFTYTELSEKEAKDVFSDFIEEVDPGNKVSIPDKSDVIPEPITDPEPVSEKLEDQLKQKALNPSIVRQTTLPTAEELKLEQVMIEMKIFYCKECGVDTKAYYSLRDHVKKEHDIKSYKLCCDKTLRPGPAAIYCHIQYHLNKDAFKCHECNITFEDPDYLNNHNNRVHLTAPRHVCEKCGKGFWNRVAYNKHVATHQGPKEECKYCGKFFSSKAVLKNHISLQHKLKVNWLCDLCGRGFYSRGQLNSHIRDHAGPHGGNRKKAPKSWFSKGDGDKHE